MNLEMKMYDNWKMGRRETAHEYVVNMLKEDMSIELIAKITGLSEDEIQDIRDKAKIDE